MPTGPGNPVPAADLTALRIFLNDPFVKLLPGLLADRGAAAGVESALIPLRESVADGRIENVSPALDAVRAKLEAYTGRAALGAGDPVVLDALQVVLLESRVLLEDANSRWRAVLALD